MLKSEMETNQMKLNQGIKKSWPASLFDGGGGEEIFMESLIRFLLEEFTPNTSQYYLFLCLSVYFCSALEIFLNVLHSK